MLLTDFKVDNRQRDATNDPNCLNVYVFVETEIIALLQLYEKFIEV